MSASEVADGELGSEIPCQPAAPPMTTTTKKMSAKLA